MNQKLEICIESALAGGIAAFNCPPSKAIVKPTKYVGKNQSITSKADYASQKAILEVLHKKDSNTFFINEENITGIKDEEIVVKVLNKDNFEKMKYSRVYIFDELCGSSSHNAGHYEYGVSVGCVENLIPIAGAIFAPAIFGNKGILFYASKGEGTFIKTNEKEKK